MINIKLTYNPETGDITSPDSDMFIARIEGLERHEIGKNDLQWWLDNHKEDISEGSARFLQECIDRI